MYRSAESPRICGRFFVASAQIGHTLVNMLEEAINSQKSNSAQLLVVSRHFVKFNDALGNEVTGVFASRGMKAVVGDRVEFSYTDESSTESSKDRGHQSKRAIVERILPRTNCFRRSYGSKNKELAANLDRLYVVTAPIPLFHTSAINRVLASAHAESIPCTLIVNKCDLENEFEATRSLIDIYSKLSFPVLEVSAMEEDSLQPLRAELLDPKISAAALIGVSGVGKSSILNVICPQAEARTGSISERSGRGKQTTSMAKGFYYDRGDTQKLLLIDLPGIQNFGISHLTRDEVKMSFTEFSELDNPCRFSNCFHLEEPDCAVLQAIEEESISKTRYDSYLEMLEELKQSAT